MLVNDVDTARLLLAQPDINVNIKDAFKDTPLHEAIVKDNAPMIDLLCNHSKIDFDAMNKRGFSSIQYAALKGSHVAMKKICEITDFRLVNAKKDDGFTPLHLASLNGHAKVAEYLLSLPQTDILAVDLLGRTSLQCAVHQGHAHVLELLLSGDFGFFGKHFDETTKAISVNTFLLLLFFKLERENSKYSISFLSEAERRGEKQKLITTTDLEGDSVLHVAMRREGDPLSPVESSTSPAFQTILENVKSSGLVSKLYVHAVAIAVKVQIYLRS